MIQISFRNRVRQIIGNGVNRFLSHNARHQLERWVLGISIFSYVVHLSLIFLSTYGIIKAPDGLFASPISAIYTPFSFILVYEVYLLIYYLPKSTSFYIGKQYEIITLIIMRRIFKDIGNLQLVPNWFRNENDLRFTYDAISSLILFLLICLFYMQVLQKGAQSDAAKEATEKDESTFLTLKKGIAVLLVPIMLLLACYSFGSWIINLFQNYQSGIYSVINLNQIFFDEFFTILIIVDVMLLLASLFYSDQFQSIMRNSGFVISTILIKLSFSVYGITNNLLIVGSVAFGLCVLLIFNLFSRKVAPFFPKQSLQENSN